MPCLSLEVLDPIITPALSQGVFPGLVYGVAMGPPESRQNCIQAAGHLFSPGMTTSCNPAMNEEVFFDLASLTKPLATALGIFSLKHRGMLQLHNRLGDLLNQPIPSDKRDITIAQLLRHSSGLPAHRPYFERLRHLPVDARSQALLAMVLDEPLDAKPGQCAVYSDLGFILLGHIIQQLSGETLDVYTARWLYTPLGLQELIAFNPLGRSPFPAATCFAPTEACPWRNKVLQGEVHDDNTHVIGGVSGQAGLFGNAEGVLTLTRFLLDLVKGHVQHPYLATEDLREAVQRQGSESGSTWGQGFDTPSDFNSSAGHLLSRLSFGHLGFTGTSFWCDPERDLVVVLLTNRVHPTRENNAIRAFRPLFHNAIACGCDRMV